MLTEATILLHTVTNMHCHKPHKNIFNEKKVKGVGVKITSQLFTFLSRHFE